MHGLVVDEVVAEEGHRGSVSSRRWTPTNARDNQSIVLIVAPRQSN